MIFVGDIALPKREIVENSNFPEYFKNKKWFGNLEGALINDDNYNLKVVYNDINSVKALVKKFQFKGFALANNHIFDVGTIEDTKLCLQKLNIPFCGIGNNINEANQEIVIEEANQKIVIINFGWEVIQCEVTNGNSKGVNPLRKEHVIKTVKDLIKKYPTSKIIPFMHWSYELEAEPQPFERELAKNLIDLGVSAIIGCHPHRIGGIEIYKNKPIVYSLGNWMFQQNFFYGKTVKFPDFCSIQLAFEWDLEENTLRFHFFKFDREKNSVVFEKTEDINGELVKSYTPFENLNNQEYITWYKTHRFHRKKGLPIYYWNDSTVKILVKNNVNKLRDFLIRFLVKLK
ncbi:CapA family protein [Tenacibaculum sp. SDUM215027]|uniref:CapA family protein n=1 Tax=Tenacibaculum sp. SDUM215027 TaxID=3422596 RepID=UPI003D32335D